MPTETVCERCERETQTTPHLGRDLCIVCVDWVDEFGVKV